MTNPFQTLGIPTNATKEEAQKAYRKSAMKFHPDRHAGSSLTEQRDAEAKFKAAKEAWEKIERGYVEPTTTSQPSYRSTTYGSAGPAQDPYGTWRNPPPPADPVRRSYRPMPRPMPQRVVEAFQTQTPKAKTNFGTFLAHVSLAEAFKGFVVEANVQGELKQFQMPKGIPNNFSKVFETNGGQITVVAKIQTSNFQIKETEKALSENVIVNSFPSKVLRLSEMTTTTSVDFRDLQRGCSLTLQDFLGENFRIQIPAGFTGGTLKVEGRGYVDWYPEHEQGGAKRGPLFIKVIPIDRTQETPFS